MDYRKFLGQSTTRVLPYFGGTRVHDVTRRLRINVEQPPGWYEFRIGGRAAIPVDRAEPPDLGEYPAVRGHFASGWCFGGGRVLHRVELLPAETPAVLSVVVVRIWPSGDAVFDSLEFESEVEDLVRQALEEERGIADIKGVGASLRAAFGFALTEKLARRRELTVSPREVMGAVLEVAEGGRDTVEVLLDALVERRRLERVRLEAWAATEGIAAPQAQAGSWRRLLEERERSPGARAERALNAAGADMVGYRSMDGGMMEVTYRFMGERFISVVNEQTLRVIDAGICLSGADSEVTLESLPSVIREGIENNELHITRR